MVGEEEMKIPDKFERYTGHSKMCVITSSLDIHMIFW